MSQSRISPLLRQTIEDDAGFRCGYCLTPQKITGLQLQIDHIMPEAKGGITVREDLWLACTACNRFKGDITTGYDAETNQIVPIFHPRKQIWSGHFKWSENGIEIIGIIPCGRATVTGLRLNNAIIVASRSLWVQEISE